MRILALGGCGVQGTFATRDLVESKDVSEVIIGDINVEKARRVAADIGSPKLSTIKIDVNDHQNLVKVMKDADVVVNFVGPYYEQGVKIVKAAIEARKNYVDGKKEGMDTKYIYSGVGRMGESTGIPASIGAQMRGVAAPEACIDPEPFIAEMLKRGYTMTETEIITLTLTQAKSSRPLGYGIKIV